MKKGLFLILSLAMVLIISSCKSKEEPVESQTQTKTRKVPIIDTSASKDLSQIKRPKMMIVVPEEIKNTWTAVTIVVEDKKENKKTEINVKLGDEFTIPDSNLRVKVGPFLPDFKMSGNVITSASNEPNNPSVGIQIFENGKKIFPASGEWGWLYAKFPTIHTFQHERFGLTLKAGTKKE